MLRCVVVFYYLLLMIDDVNVFVIRLIFNMRFLSKSGRS